MITKPRKDRRKRKRRSQRKRKLKVSNNLKKRLKLNQ
jgi:hypothetical protein